MATDPLRVVVVEDDPTRCLLIEQVLREHGIDAPSVQDPLAALQTRSETASLPDMLLVDRHVPGMDGPTFVRT